MKRLLIALLALTMTLGVACKKSNDVADSKPATELKKEVSLKLPKPVVLGDAKGGNTVDDPDQGYPTGKDTYPHCTGLCYCGVYSVCHPEPPANPNPGTNPDLPQQNPPR